MGRNLGFIERFDKFILEKKFFKKNDRILIGFSGGADSTALLQALWMVKSKYRLFLIAAHINYNLRDEDSKKDEEFVKNFCFERNISLVIKDVKLNSKSGIENSARKIRFKYFKKLEKLYNVNKIVLGHNRKDQVETMLFRLFRGAGYTGIQGIAPQIGKVVHPLLPFSREQIEHFLNERNIIWREDLSNQENKFSRNKIRNELIPWIQKNINSDVIDKLYNATTIFSQTDDILEMLAKRRLRGALKKKNENSFTLDIPTLKKIKSVLRFYIYRELFSRLNNDAKDFYHTNFEEIEDILNSNGSKKLNLPNKIYVFKEYDEMIFTNKNLADNSNVNNSKIIDYLRNRLTFEDYRISMKKLKILPPKHKLREKQTAYFDLDKITFPLQIRHRKAGDFFTPLGMQHNKKLKQFFIDEKVPKFERNNVLIFCDEDKIIWICGHRIDNRVATSENTKNILMLKVEKKTQKKLRSAQRVGS